MKIKNVKSAEPPYPFEAYAHVVAPLSEEDGGGYMITFPDLPGCMSDGDTLDEVLRGTVQRDKGRFSLLAH